MLTFYILVGLGIGLFVAFSIVQPILQDAIQAGVSNLFTEHPTLTLSVNTLMIVLVWPVFTPIFFSLNIKDQVVQGFTKAIHTED